MEATVLVEFVDRKQNKRFHTGDVVTMSVKDFERITKQGNYLKKGRHRFGSGTCHPCNRKTKKGN